MRFRIPGRPWFKPLRFGAMPQPTRWEGWAFTACYVGGLALFAEAAGLAPPFEMPAEPLAFLAGSAVLTAVYALFVWLKSEVRHNSMPGSKANMRVKRVGDTQKGRIRWL